MKSEASVTRRAVAILALFPAAAMFGQTKAEDAQAVLEREIQRTKPDYIVYRPGSVDGSSHDTMNEHFLVFDGPDGSLMAVWTQCTYEGAGDHRIVFARSTDEGETWSQPVHLAGPPRKVDGKPVDVIDPMQFSGEIKNASWGFPVISKQGRIYVLYNQYKGIKDTSPHVTGTMDCVYSDDMGETWSGPQTVPMARSPHDHPDPKVPSNWIVWQMPMRDLKGRWFVGFTRYLSTAVRTKPREKRGWMTETVVEFMRFENIDENPAPSGIRVTFSAWGDQSLRIPHYLQPELSVAQEPSIVRLPDKRLFCAMRSITGYIWYSISDDDGYTWTSPRPLLRKDHGRPILHPISCTPIYPISEGTYFLLHNNHDGRFEGSQPEDARVNRRPCYLVRGEFRPEAEQPVWFSESKFLLDNDGVPVGPLKTVPTCVYTSMTNRDGNLVLWHPDRKFFLLGKRITREFLTGLHVPVSAKPAAGDSGPR